MWYGEYGVWFCRASLQAGLPILSSWADQVVVQACRQHLGCDEIDNDCDGMTDEETGGGDQYENNDGCSKAAI